MLDLQVPLANDGTKPKKRRSVARECRAVDVRAAQIVGGSAQAGGSPLAM